jgi:hypothetical protein
LSPTGLFTLPTKTSRRKRLRPKETAFDPVAFACKLQYTEQAEQLGFTEQAAKDFFISFYRGQVYIPIRHSDGSISGFVGYVDGQMKLPPKWLTATSVTFSKKSAEKKPPRNAGLSLHIFFVVFLCFVAVIPLVMPEPLVFCAPPAPELVPPPALPPAALPPVPLVPAAPAPVPPAPAPPAPAPAPPAPPAPWAIARVEPSAKKAANAIVVIFICLFPPV